MRIVLTGGGSGGHVTPFGPIIVALRSLYQQEKNSWPGRLEPSKLSLYFLGVNDRVSRQYFKSYKVRSYHIPSGKLRRYALGLTIFDLLFRLPLGILLALVRMWWLMPEVVVSKGAYGSIPVVLAAVFYRIPVLLHESDAVLGLTNRFLARFATAIAVSFSDTKQHLKRYEKRTVVTGIPVRQDLAAISRSEARRAFRIPDKETVVMVIGGSQGAEQLNQLILQILPSLILDATVIHVTGPAHHDAVSAVAHEILASSPRKSLYQAYPYLTDKLPHALVTADVVVSRAGATTLAELAYLKKPAVVIPFDSAANDHQRHNAQVYEKHGAIRVLDPTNAGSALFARNLYDLVRNPSLRQELSQRIGTLAKPQAAEEIAALSFKLAAGFKLA